MYPPFDGAFNCTTDIIRFLPPRCLPALRDQTTLRARIFQPRLSFSITMTTLLQLANKKKGGNGTSFSTYNEGCSKEIVSVLVMRVTGCLMYILFRRHYIDIERREEGFDQSGITCYLGEFRSNRDFGVCIYRV